MNTKTYQRIYRKDNELICEEVVEKSNPIQTLNPKLIATITAIGPNGRFEFKLDSKFYVTITATNVCREIPTENYYDYSKVIFDIPIQEIWSKLYNSRKELLKSNSWRRIDNIDRQSIKLI